MEKGIAYQIRASRIKAGLSQADLANATAMKQNNISRLESPDYGKYSLASLKRIADALDVALVVRFVPFSQYIDWLSGTQHLDQGLSPEALAVPSYEQEETKGVYETHIRYWGVITPPVEIEVLASDEQVGSIVPFATREITPFIPQIRSEKAA